MNKCELNYIYRSPYTRTSSSGKSVRVKGGCIKSRSLSGRKGYDLSILEKRKQRERKAQHLTGTEYLKCPSGMIKRAGYIKKSHKRITRNGDIVIVRQKVVPAGCIKSKGIGSSVRIPIINKDELGQFGYSDVRNISLTQRKRALNRAVDSLGYLPVIKKLNALATVNKNRNPEVSHVFKMDQEWLSKKYKEGGKVKSVIYKKY